MEKGQLEIKDFVFNSLSGESSSAHKTVDFAPLERDTLSLERRKGEIQSEEKLAEEKGFDILDLAQEQVERKKQREQDKKNLIENEVTSRLKVVEKEVFDKAHEEGIQAGKEEIASHVKVAADEQLNILTNLVDDLLKSKEKLYQEQKKQLLFMVKNLVQWIILRELKDDGKYLESLLEKLVSELQTQTNLNIQVNKKDFEKMPEVLTSLQKKIGELKNVRLVIDYDLPEKGMVLDSDNGMIKSSTSEQFHALDKLFEKIGVFNKDFTDEENET
jgi:flagellar assembly protein FliH